MLFAIDTVINQTKYEKGSWRFTGRRGRSSGSIKYHRNKKKYCIRKIKITVMLIQIITDILITETMKMMIMALNFMH